MSESEDELEKRLDELDGELRRVNTSFPSLEELDGWIPKGVNEKERIVFAEKVINEKNILRKFEPVGVWKKIYDLIVLRNKILHDFDRIETKLHGQAIFTSKEFAENDDL